MRFQPGHPFLDLDKATVGREERSMFEMNTRQVITTHDLIPYVAPFKLVPLAGKVIGFNPASSAPGYVIVHVDKPGNPIILTLGTKRVIPVRFEQLFLQLPNGSPYGVISPQDATRAVILDVGETNEDIQYGPLPANALQAGADAPAVTRIALTNAVGPAATLIAANPNRRGVIITNQSGGPSMVYGFANTVTYASGAALGRLLAPGQTSLFLPTTSAIYGVLEVAGPGDVVIEEYK